jgi:phosphate-selective porin OprO and OprP
MTMKSRLLLGAAVSVLLPGGQALAQATPAMTGQIQQLQQQIQQLQQALQSLQSQVNAQAQAQAAKPAAPPVPPGPRLTQSPGNRFSIESADGKYSIGLSAQLHLDVGGTAYHPDSIATAPHDVNAGVNARRARLGILGKIDGDWFYTFVYDFGGTNDSGVGLAANAGSAGIEKAYLTYNGLYSGPFPVAFDLGYQDVPFTLDEATSSNDIMFMERASSQVVATELGTGDNRSAFGIRSNDDRYWAGVYATGPTSGSNHSNTQSSTSNGNGEPLAMFGRLTYQVATAPNYSLHVGVGAEGMVKSPTSGGVRTVTLSDRPELRIDPSESSLLNSGALGTVQNPLNSAAAYEVELAGGYDNLFLQGEGFDFRINRQGVPANNFYGGYLEGSWTATGEHRNYIPATGAYSSIIPALPFSWSAGQWGAFEFAIRYSYMNLDDNVGSAVADAAAVKAGTPVLSNGIAGGKQQIVTLGLNWYLNPNIKFVFNYLHGIVDKPGSSAAGANPEAGASFDAVAMRTQIAF